MEPLKSWQVTRILLGSYQSALGHRGPTIENFTIFLLAALGLLQKSPENLLIRYSQNLAISDRKHWCVCANGNKCRVHSFHKGKSIKQLWYFFSPVKSRKKIKLNRNSTVNPYYNMPYEEVKCSSSVQRSHQEEVAIAFLPLRTLQTVSEVQNAVCLLSLVGTAQWPCSQNYRLSAWNIMCGLWEHGPLFLLAWPTQV